MSINRTNFRVILNRKSCGLFVKNLGVGKGGTQDFFLRKLIVRDKINVFFLLVGWDGEGTLIVSRSVHAVHSTLFS